MINGNDDDSPIPNMRVTVHRECNPSESRKRDRITDFSCNSSKVALGMNKLLTDGETRVDRTTKG
jgi:hypothetical protein